jgi:hypothetical protein
MAPEELRLDSPESKSFVGNRSAKPQQFYGISSDSNNISTNTAGDDSSDASISDLVIFYLLRI